MKILKLAIDAESSKMEKSVLKIKIFFFIFTGWAKNPLWLPSSSFWKWNLKYLNNPYCPPSLILHDAKNRIPIRLRVRPPRGYFCPNMDPQGPCPHISVLRVECDYAIWRVGTRARVCQFLSKSTIQVSPQGPPNIFPIWLRGVFLRNASAYFSWRHSPDTVTVDGKPVFSVYTMLLLILDRFWKFLIFFGGFWWFPVDWYKQNFNSYNGFRVTLKHVAA